MIVVDTSALMAIVLEEPKSEACIAALQAEAEVLISGSYVSRGIGRVVAAARRLGDGPSPRKLASKSRR